MTPFSKAVEQELARARTLYPQPMATPHDAHGKNLEEVTEFFDEVRKREAHHNPQLMLVELVQIGAMAQRAAEDLKLIDCGTLE